MGDAAEGLIDAEARIQERMEELERPKKPRPPIKDPDRMREAESLRLAKAELEQQLEATRHPVRRQQIEAAIEELDRRIAESAA
jgi:hypothetical protein